jgi:hypothetical protein
VIDLLARDLRTPPRLCDAQGKPLGPARVFPPDTSKLPLPPWLPEEYELHLAASLNVPQGGIYFLLNWRGKLITHGVPFEDVPPGTVREFTVTITQANAVFRERGELIRQLDWERDQQALKDFPHPHSMLTEAAVMQQVQLHALSVRPLAGSRNFVPPALTESTEALDVPPPPQAVTSSQTNSLNLLAQIDAARDARRGQWALANGKLQVTASPANAQLALPHTPASEFVLELGVTRTSGTEPLRISFPIRGRPCTLLVDGWGGTASGLTLGYQSSPRGAYLARGEAALTSGKQGKISIAVRSERIVVEVDGRKLFDLPGNPQWALPLASVQGALQLDVGPQTSCVFDEISITEFGPSP